MVVLALAVAFAGFGTAGAVQVASDEHAGVHQPNIDELAEMGIFDGTECEPGRFCPAEPIKRWVVAVWLVRVLDGGDPAPDLATRFADVDAEAWWAPHVERLAQLKVTLGCKTSPARFCPDNAVTRAQMASFLARAFELDAGRPDAGFADVGDSVHRANINAIAAAGITVGCDTNPARYCPSRAVTRARWPACSTGPDRRLRSDLRAPYRRHHRLLGKEPSGRGRPTRRALLGRRHGLRPFVRIERGPLHRLLGEALPPRRRATREKLPCRQRGHVLRLRDKRRG